MMEAKRGEDNAFKCKCGKIFKLPDSLRRHAKSWTGKLAESEQAKEVNAIDSDVSESLDLYNKVVDNTPANCYGTLFHVKSANCKG